MRAEGGKELKAKEKLVAQAKKGNKEAFQQLMSAEKEKLYKMAYVYMRNEEEALEVFQETVYQALVSISTLTYNEYFSTWVTRILINQAIAMLKKKQKVIPMSKEIVEQMDQPIPVKTEERLDLFDAMAEIEEKYKTVLLLRFYKDLTVKQISLLLKVPEGTVKTNIHRGLKELKQKLKGAYYDERRNSFI